MSGIAEFLLARIAEDEGAARAASPGPWHLNAESTEVIAVDDIQVAEAFALSSNQLRATAAHIARWDPARVLAECDSKRRIVDDHAVYAKDMADAPSDFAAGRLFMARLALAELALAYADHPDYDESWRP